MLKLPRLPQRFAIVDKMGIPVTAFMNWWQSFAKAIEDAFNALADTVAAVAAAQAAADAANAAAAAADAAAIGAQAAADDAATAAAASATEMSIVNSFVKGFAGASPLEADSAGNVTVKNHTRQYGDTVSNPDVPITGTILATGQASPDVVRVHYDDVTLSDGTPTFVFTVDPASAPVQGGARHVVGAVEIPAAGTSDGGFVRQPGYTDIIP